MKHVKYMVLVLLTIGLFAASCKKYVPYVNQPDNDFGLTVTDTTGIRNDGTSLVNLMLAKTTDIKHGLSATLSTQNGTIVNTTISFDTNTLPSVPLQVSQDTGYYFIKAVIMNGSTVITQKTLKFTLRPAFPDSLGLEPDNIKVAIKTPLTLKTLLTRKFGKVSLHTMVTFRSFQISTQGDTVVVGSFTGLLGNTSDLNGKLADIQFHANTTNIDTLKALIIQARTMNDQHKPVIKSLVFKF
jgi:hypothetical protein